MYQVLQNSYERSYLWKEWFASPKYKTLSTYVSELCVTELILGIRIPIFYTSFIFDYML